MKSSTIDGCGLRHLLLCRVILGKMELVHPDTEQSHPSSEEFDSGVDNLLSPKRYIIWSTHMNTHILPEYVISFRAPTCIEGKQFDIAFLLSLHFFWVAIVNLFGRFLNIF